MENRWIRPIPHLRWYQTSTGFEDTSFDMNWLTGDYINFGLTEMIIIQKIILILIIFASCCIVNLLEWFELWYCLWSTCLNLFSWSYTYNDKDVL